MNAGTLSNLNVGNGYTALVQFDLSPLPAGTTAAQITKATLRVYCNRADVPGAVQAQLLGAAWSESTVTYATLPPLGATVQTAQVAAAGEFVTFDVTSAVQGWVLAPGTNFGLALVAATGTAVQFDSKENDQTSHAPELEIVLVDSGPVGPQGPQGAAGVTGATGPSGPAGPAGPQGPQGLPGTSGTGSGIAYLGTYDAAINYAIGDVVQWGGSSWVSLMAGNLGSTPGTSALTWGMLAAAGSPGSAGAVGPMGPQGPMGLSVQGPAGPVGPQGVAGPAGATGPQGLSVQGPMGPQGPVGAVGPAGSPGLVYQGAYNPSGNYSLGDVVVFQGSSYVSLTGFNVGQTPGLSGAYWGLLTAQGPAGATGAQGAPGPEGPQGLLGPVGPPGQTGAQGAQGIAGEAGAQGIPGTQGATGPGGPMGPQGAAGPVGMSFAGAYDSTLNYAVGDGVLWQGAGWVSLHASNHGNTPSTSPADWAMFAASGAAGLPGAQGPAGLPGLNGLDGLPGPVGPMGPTGATGTAGSPGLVYQGAYSSLGNYSQGDVVVFAGASWVSLATGNVGQTPGTNSSYWGVLTSQGAQGAAGPAGAVGPMGPVGLQGLAGPIGPPGVAGPIGIQGPAGAQGLTGAAGSPGPAGPQGLQGAAGSAGSQGLTGATGADGPQGPAGPTGAIGPVGMSFIGDYDSSMNYALGNGVLWQGAGWVSLIDNNHGNTPSTSPTDWAMFSAPGATGATGATGAPGVQGPMGPPGLNGATGAQGVPGTQGLQGEIGPAGPQGVPGPSGMQGPAGAQGLTGTTGATGSAGPQGLQGVAGSAGAQGLPGATGPTGPAGATGTAGPQGATGAAGAPGAPGAPGAVGMNFRGVWSAATQYALNDAVTFAGSTYLAQVAGSNAEPDLYPSNWAVLAQSGGTGATGAQGAAATVSVGSVTTLAAGSAATVTNSGTPQAAVLNFGIPQGAAGTGGSSGSSTSSGTFAAMYHAVSFTYQFYSVNTPGSSGMESAVMAWIPLGCTATELDVYSQQSGAITVTLRAGAAGALQSTALSCSPVSNASCKALGSVAIGAGQFIDLSITQSSGNPAGVWTSLQCQ